MNHTIVANIVKTLGNHKNRGKYCDCNGQFSSCLRIVWDLHKTAAQKLYCVDNVTQQRQ